jgi:hypothetical protein
MRIRLAPCFQPSFSLRQRNSCRIILRAARSPTQIFDSIAATLSQLMLNSLLGVVKDHSKRLTIRRANDADAVAKIGWRSSDGARHDTISSGLVEIMLNAPSTAEVGGNAESENARKSSTSHAWFGSARC